MVSGFTTHCSPSQIYPIMQSIVRSSKKVVVCTAKPQKLFGNLYTTGVLGEEMPEHSLIIKEKETKLISGCGHFGIENIVKVAKEVIGEKIDYVIGGFHLLRSNDTQIEHSIQKLQELGVSKVLPTHCTGDRAIEMYKKSFKKNYTLGGIGTKI